MHELAELCGMQNAFADIEGWQSVSQEQAIERNPDYIVLVTGMGEISRSISFVGLAMPHIARMITHIQFSFHQCRIVFQQDRRYILFRLSRSSELNTPATICKSAAYRLFVPSYCIYILPTTAKS